MSTIWITGSGRRIGRGLAIEFAKKGWDVAVHYNGSEAMAHKTVEDIQKLGRKTALVKADVRNHDEISNAFEEIVSSLGVPDVLVNNSGIFPPQTPLDKISADMWDNVLDINLRGEFYCSQVFASKARKGSKIINIASLGGLEVWKYRIPYNVSKAGVIHLTKALARELAPDIAVNSVCPGAIILPDEPAVETSDVPANKIPMKRYGNLMDIFDAIYFFATASDYITGQNIAVDGGLHHIV